MFGERLKKLRKDRKMSQTELGMKIGTGPHVICRYETGKNVPSAETIIKLAKIFNISADYLLLDTPTKEALENENPELLKRLKDIELLDANDREFLFQILDTLITKKKMQEILKKSA